MSNVRRRRLQADHDKLQDFARRHPRVKLILAEGDPPERYHVEYNLRSLRRVHEELVEVTNHLVEVVLTGHYPRLPPQCRMLTPIFHPNIAPHAICIGDHWSAGEPLWSLIARIGEMISYQSYNIKSPLNGEAARWVATHEEELPLDPVSMLVEESTSATAKATSTPSKTCPAPPRPAAEPAASSTRSITCPKCETILLVSPLLAGKRARCAKCQTIITIPAD